MLKKIPFKTILLTLFAWMLFWEVKETITGEQMIFIVRWLYSEKSTAKNLEVLTYLLTDEQVAYMLSHPDEVVHQPSNNDLRTKNVNVVLRIRNLKDGLAWGRLSWTIPGRLWSKVDVHDIPLPGDSKKYCDRFIPIGIIVTEKNESPPGPIIVKWDELYVYR